jgi:hypothetical protein
MQYVPAKRSKRVIGFIGYATSGKDFLSSSLTGAVAVRFSASLKHIAASYLGVSLGELEACKKQLRPFLVALGQGARYALPQIWSMLVAQQIAKLNADLIVVPDVRDVGDVSCLLSLADQFDVRLVLVESFGVGPANQTEKRTIAEIRSAFPLIESFMNDKRADPAHTRKRFQEYIG